MVRGCRNAFKSEASPKICLQEVNAMMFGSSWRYTGKLHDSPTALADKMLTLIAEREHDETD